MYESIFNFEFRPFLAVPSPDSYFPAESIENARICLQRLIRRDEGPGLVIGPVGIGKSLLANLLAEQLKPTYRVALIPGARICTRRSLIQIILHQFGLPFKDMEEGELRLSLIDHVTSSDFCPNGSLIILDEADSLPMSLLDELRTMTNTVSDNKYCVRLLLFGALNLEEKIGHPRMESLNQRLAGRFYLEPFDREETIDYITFQIEQCGGDASELFTLEVMDTAYQATNGVPRLINQLCDHALILAATEGKTVIDIELINAAWSDLQQLPTPSIDRMHAVSSSIEFGELNDAPPTENGTGVDLDDDTHAVDECQTSASESTVDIVEPTTLRIHSEADHEDFELPDETPESSTNPFDETFENEEVVLDQFMAAKIIAKRNQRTVQCERSEALSISIRQYIKKHSIVDESSSSERSANNAISAEDVPDRPIDDLKTELSENLVEEKQPTGNITFSDDPVYAETNDNELLKRVFDAELITEPCGANTETVSQEEQSNHIPSAEYVGTGDLNHTFPENTGQPVTLDRQNDDDNENESPVQSPIDSDAPLGTDDLAPVPTLDGIDSVMQPNVETEEEHATEEAPTVSMCEASIPQDTEIGYKSVEQANETTDFREICYDPIIVESDYPSPIEEHSTSENVPRELDSNGQSQTHDVDPTEEIHIVPIVRPDQSDQNPRQRAELELQDFRSSKQNYKRLFLKLRKAN